MARTHNILVISDLHLGEDLGPSATEAATLHIDLVEKQLVQFLRYYTRRRENGKAWRLVINGDMLDFMAVTLLPAPEERATREEREFGYHRTPAVAVAKLQKMCERHPAFFSALARFVARGNSVDVIPGNHDAEFHFPEVHDVFRREVVAAWIRLGEGAQQGALSADEIAELITFHPWFYFEPGLIWIEHGHQYDEHCSFEYQLTPRLPNTDAIMTNVDTAGTRYITSYVLEAESHQQEDWSFIGYLSFGVGLGLRSGLRLWRGYRKFTTSLLKAHHLVAKNPEGMELARVDHVDKLNQLAKRWKLPVEALHRIDDLRRRPVVSHRRRLMSVLMLDKLLVYIPVILISLIAVIWFGVAWGGLVALSMYGLGTVATWWTGRDRMIDPAMSLEIVSERILRRVDAKFVVFGHTHEPVAKELDSGGWYYNLGTWVPSGKPGLLSAFTHLVVKGSDDDPEIGLCQWRDGASRWFVPKWNRMSLRKAKIEQRKQRKKKLGTTFPADPLSVHGDGPISDSANHVG